MTDRVGELVPGVLAEVADRAGHGFDRWVGDLPLLVDLMRHLANSSFIEALTELTYDQR